MDVASIWLQGAGCRILRNISTYITLYGEYFNYQNKFGGQILLRKTRMKILRHTNYFYCPPLWMWLSQQWANILRTFLKGARKPPYLTLLLHFPLGSIRTSTKTGEVSSVVGFGHSTCGVSHWEMILACPTWINVSICPSVFLVHIVKTLYSLGHIKMNFSGNY